MIFRQIVFYALLVAALSGMALTIVQMWQVVPIIHSAEVFEAEAASVPTIENAGQLASAHDLAHGDLENGWAPSDGIERTAYTLLSNVLTAFGFALAMLVAMVATSSLKRNGETRFDWWRGFVWGAAGYLVFWLSPAIGLPPEIPLAAAADLEARQIWWLFAVVSTAAGLAGVAFGKSPWRWAAPLLILVPHLVGAPHAPGAMFADQSPQAAAQLEQLAQQFIAATAIANIVFWLVLGLASVWAIRRIVTASENETDAGTELPKEFKSPSV